MANPFNDHVKRVKKESKKLKSNQLVELIEEKLKGKTPSVEVQNQFSDLKEEFNERYEALRIEIFQKQLEIINNEEKNG